MHTITLTCPICEEPQTSQAVWDDDDVPVATTHDLSTQPGWHWELLPGTYDCGH